MARPGAWAVVRGDEPQLFLASSVDVLNRVLAYQLVAQADAREIQAPGRLEYIREALLAERWGEALIAYMEATGLTVDVYDEAPKVWTSEELDEEQALMEIRMAPLFADPPQPTDG